MIGMRTILEVADNSGARRLSCILPRGGDLGLRAGLGDVVTAAVKEAAPDSAIKKGKVVRCVIVRMRKESRRKDGTYIRFDSNAAVLISCAASRGVSPAFLTSYSLSPTHTAATVMRFSVSVPVLSTHIIVAAPSVSMTAARRTKTFRCASRHAPMAIKTARTIGNSSGSKAIASVIPASAPSIQLPRSKP